MLKKKPHIFGVTLARGLTEDACVDMNVEGLGG